ncbi:MAG: xanthine dehydrogenase family protein molybdopterin-binding subunit [Alphaproteobacteria bacterium]|nr:xanthine dehydrogenase family protein molybdopterin-binding subunit [Alphaproteobacteria bacterium]
MGVFAVGQPYRRKEDDRFIIGKGRYGDDVNIPGQTYACFVRSPHAHARILGIDGADALAAPGVIAVLTGSDMAASDLGGMPCIAELPGRNGGRANIKPYRSALCMGVARHVGDPVAMVIAATWAQARDAAEMVMVEYEELPAVTEAIEALKPGAPQIWPEAPGNLVVDWELGDRAGTEAAFAGAHHVTRLRLVNNRLVANAMEPRMVIAEYDAASDHYTVHTSTQGVFRWRGLVAEAVFRIPQEKMRVRTYDVGGSFGMKAFLYPEQIAAIWAAKHIGRTVKWTGERSESFLSDNQGRDQINDAEMALDRDGRMLAVRVKTTSNVGAYVSVMGPGVSTIGAGGLQVGVYAIPVMYLNVTPAFTNTTPTDAYRGAGRPEAAYIIERLVDAAAREMGIAPDELRARNFIRPDQMPYANAGGYTYDSGNFLEVMNEAKRLADWDGFAARKRQRRARGELSGIGMAYYVERAGGPPMETARVDVLPDETIRVFMGNQSNGMGHETVYAQIMADALGVPFERISVTSGDTSELPAGGLSGGSGSGLMGGGAATLAAEATIAKGRLIAAEQLEAAPADIEFEAGHFRIAGTDRSISLWDTARAAGPQGLGANGEYHNTPFQFPNGCHIIELGIEPETGIIRIHKYTAVDDFGHVLNPMIVEGQVQGGIVQGLGQAMGEHAVYDPGTGQMLSGSFLDYWMPRADDMPDFDIAYLNTPCTTNEMGIKGCGEAGSTGAPPAFINAVLDAVAHLGIRHLDMPLTPFAMWQALQGAHI